MPPSTAGRKGDNCCSVCIIYELRVVSPCVLSVPFLHSITHGTLHAMQHLRRWVCAVGRVVALHGVGLSPSPFHPCVARSGCRLHPLKLDCIFGFFFDLPCRLEKKITKNAILFLRLSRFADKIYTLGIYSTVFLLGIYDKPLIFR